MIRYVIPAVAALSFPNMSMAESNASKTYPSQEFVQKINHTSTGNGMTNDSSTMTHDNMASNSMAGTGDSRINATPSIETSTSGTKMPMDTPSSSSDTSKNTMNTPMDMNSSTNQERSTPDGVSTSKNSQMEGQNPMAHGAMEGSNSMNSKK